MPVSRLADEVIRDRFPDQARRQQGFDHPLPRPEHIVMNRLQTELRRLYLPQGREDPWLNAGRLAPSLSDSSVRAMVMELGRSAGWDAAATLWHGVQDGLGLPAPAIAVSGHDGYQLWFSLLEPVSAGQAHEFLELLRQRFIADVAPQHVRLLPEADVGATGQFRHARLVPWQLQDQDRWSAFVAPDLASLFDAEPWLDLPPGSDAQADLLARLGSIAPEEFELALQRLRPPPAPEPGLPAPETPTSRYRPTLPASDSQAGYCLDPRQFLLDVMNDPEVEMCLRIEAARALLPGLEEQRPRSGDAGGAGLA